MPTYDYECPACAHAEELVHSIRECDVIRPCPVCSTAMGRVITRVQVRAAPDSGWEYENAGRGRYISQLQRKPGPEGSDPDAFCRTQREAIEKTHRRGLVAIKA